MRNQESGSIKVLKGIINDINADEDLKHLAVCGVLFFEDGRLVTIGGIEHSLESTLIALKEMIEDRLQYVQGIKQEDQVSH
jgi:hypothetical protein